MSEAKVLSIRRELVFEGAKFAVLLGAAIAAPLIRHQLITGSIVNCLLYLSVITLGIRGAFLIALVPSVFSLSVGLLPPVLAPMIPFIMIGNIILILVFDFSRRKNFWASIISASVLKFLFLWSTSFLVINLLLKKELAQQVAVMMAWPQIITAISGGILAFIFLKFVGRFGREK